MTRAVLLVTPVVAVAAVLLTGERDPAPLWLAAILGYLGGLLLWSLEVARVRRLARRINRWAGQSSARPLELSGGTQWRELATALNALGTQLRSTRAELRSIVPWTDRLVRSLSEPAFVFDDDHRLAAANESAAEVFNLAPVGAPPSALSALGSAAAAGAVHEAASTGRMVTVDDARGERDLRITASPLDDHVLVVVTDRTRQRQVEELRRDFVTNASHELKTPVAAISALTQALRVARPERREDLLDRLDEEGARLSRMVRDLLDLRRLEDERADVGREPVDLVHLVRAAVAEQAAAATDAGIVVELELPERAIVAGVANDLRLVVDNLVANAIQYNRPEGRVGVCVEHDDGAQVLRVADTGIGIPQQAIGRVFERFYRVDVARSRERGGTGLGLSIVRNAVERHGGRIGVESLLGSGTTVTVRLPVEPR